MSVIPVGSEYRAVILLPYRYNDADDHTPRIFGWAVPRESEMPANVGQFILDKLFEEYKENHPEWADERDPLDAFVPGEPMVLLY